MTHSHNDYPLVHLFSQYLEFKRVNNEIENLEDPVANAEAELKTLDEQFAAGIARPALPTMGWRSWNWFAYNIDQEIMAVSATAGGS